jgi:heterodisulfide reductase subunit A
MNTVKDTLLLRDHYPDTECSVFYMDIRAFGKSFEEFYLRSKEEGVKYIRSLPGEIEEDPATGNLNVVVENTNGNGSGSAVNIHEFDMVVLSTGVIPRGDSPVIRKLLTLSKTSDGFLMEAHPRLKPVDAPTRGVFMAGCAESPKDIKDSVAQAGAAASHANILLNAGEISIEAITSTIDEALCNGCELCLRVCPYHAIQSNGPKNPPTIITAACAGCGNCGAACPTGSITMKHFTDVQIEAQIDAICSEDADQKVVAFACNWCSYAGGDFAGISRLQYPTDARLIRTMCSARVDEEFIWRAFRQGAAMVLVSGCHYADCHYIDANRQTVVRVNRIWDKLEKLGIRPERLQLEWISAAEGQKFAKVMRDIEGMRKAVTKEEVEETVRILNEEEEQKQKKKLAKEAKQAATASAPAPI